MVQDSERHDRTRPIHGVLHLPNKPTIVLGTVCTKERKPWLAKQHVQENLVNIWTNAQAWVTGRYVIMPDHIHFFAAATESAISFDNWVRYWKSLFSKSHSVSNEKWQSNHWDTRLRSSNMYEEKWNYVRHNPVRHGLVDNAEEWPFQGEVFELRWD